MNWLSHVFFFLLRCGNINWAKRTKCNICNTNKPGHNEGGVRYWIGFYSFLYILVLVKYIVAPSHPWWKPLHDDYSLCMLGSVWVCLWSVSWSLFVKCIPLCFMGNTMKYFILGDWEISTYEVLSSQTNFHLVIKLKLSPHILLTQLVLGLHMD